MLSIMTTNDKNIQQM